ncbi:hypothetical protein FT663_04677 [Candidozyma haemuli var. vulneris]|uniref:Glucosidase II subunit alpha n=1 Tax=Candidozyma haemuli TaxID=45357 RepID=A0A2V1AZX5_9ASCO|nr:hypothetical protein CXQ85_002948 [[Candida] haemuloni]KAF3986910.1 hypothetical protein FT663_04677 [[Candida] haemuloni var. vulneris]KAF3991380.1 hypothetical protein FT662_01735 [[Candida] haemuloni var. vulneris]PVH23219.1 hypothetical protein CXQ85_002948 [[Candida] haemuloni]
MQGFNLLILSCLWLQAWAAKDNLFKNCDQSGFCSRNRHYRRQVEASGQHVPYFVDPQSLEVLEDQKIEGTILKKLESNELVWLPFELSLLKGDNVRFKIDEDRSGVNVKGVNTKRYDETAQAIFDAPETGKYDSLKDKVKITKESVTLTYGTDGQYKAVLDLNSVILTVFYKGEAQISFNSKQLLNFEHYRTEKTNGLHTHSELESTFDMFHDSFEDAKEDTRKLGPESVAGDIVFHEFQHVYGIPEHPDKLSLKETTDTQWPYRLFNVDIFEYYSDSRMPMYGSIPIMVATKPEVSVGVLWMNSADTYVDVKKNSKPKDVSTHWISEAGVLDLVISVGEKPDSINQNLGRLTGYVALPQLFALGYHQCRWNYNDEDDVLDISSKFDEHGMPYDTIWLDVDYTDQRKYFTWHPDAFPDPAGMSRKLDHTGRNLVILLDPHFKLGYEVSDEVDRREITQRDANNATYKRHCWPGESLWIDSLNPSAQVYWDKLHEYSKDNKVFGEAENIHIWNDMSEPSVFDGPETSAHKDNLHYGGWEHRSLHNLVGKSFHELTYKSLVKRYQDKTRQRPFILTRSFFAGSQRTAAFWTGDNMAKWEYLQTSIPMMLTSSVVNMPFSGSDVGGFFGDPSSELLTRWYQTGMWYPFFRAHAHHDSKRREPWVAGEPFSGYMRDALRLRYALLPAFYTAFYESSTNGAPVIRPLFYSNPENTEAYGIDDQFFLGNTGLMVKPVTEKNTRNVQVYIPDTGIYYDYTSGVPHPKAVSVSSPGYIKRGVELGDIPMYLKGGSILPRKDRYRRSSKLMHNDPYHLVVALDKKGDAQGLFYLDDEESFKYKDGDFAVAAFEATDGTIKGSLFVGNAKFTEDLERIFIEKITILGAGDVSSAQVSQNGKKFKASIVKHEGHIEIVGIKIQIDKDWSVKLQTAAAHDEL